VKIGYVSLIVVDKVPGKPYSNVGRYAMRDSDAVVYTKWSHASTEITYLKTVKDSEKNRVKLHVERAELLTKGEPVYLLRHELRPDDKGYGENRALRRWRQRVIARLMRKLLKGRSPAVIASSQQATVDAAIAEEKRRREESGLALPGSEEFDKTRRGSRK